VKQHLVSLNEAQREAVIHPGGPLLVLAGAGSGKTRVLTLRLAWLIEELGVAPWKLMAVTFTNKAASEMKERVDELLGGRGSDCWVSTFHSSCLRILRREIDAVEGLENNFAIYDDRDSKQLVKLIMKELRTPDSVNPRGISAAIDRAKNDGLTPSDLAKERRPDVDPRTPEIYRRYQERLRQSNAVDFGDLMLEVVHLFEQRGDVLQKYQDRFEHLMVDEYQDTNHVQYKLMRLLGDHGERNLCVVGDEDQSIYSFRGADIRNILDFERDFEGAKVVRLERNYRSTETILRAASAVVEANSDRLGKTLWTDSGLGEPIELKVSYDDREEARKALEIVASERRRGRRASEIAVFYRTNSQSRVLEEECIAGRIPFVLIGGQRFYERREVKDVMSYLKLILNPDDDIAFLRTLNTPPRGIGQGTREKVLHRAHRDGTSCWRALISLADDAAETTRVRKSLTGYRQLVEDLRSSSRQVSIEDLVEQVYVKSGLWERFESEGTFEAQGRLENLAELKNSTSPYKDLPPPTGLLAFLDRVSLIADTDKIDSSNEDTEGRVTLMTVHASKGLEFPVVLVVGMDEELFPHARARLFEKELEEERRLAYVAITRAREKLYLLRARRRMRSGMYQDTVESRFLRQIPRDLVTGDTGYRSERGVQTGPIAWSPDEPRVVYDTPGSGAWRSRFDGGQKRPQQTKPRSPLPVSVEPELPEAAGGDEERVVLDEGAQTLGLGARVLHPQFGEGVVKSLDGSPDNMRATVFFRRGGEKRLYVRFANLEILGGGY
jgi:DNA helicase-2/ATP-dependent DNA helicase PcrA